jgi:hypothetical protein
MASGDRPIEPRPVGSKRSDRTKRIDDIDSGALPYRQSRATLAGIALGRRLAWFILLWVAGVVAVAAVAWVIRLFLGL